MHRTGNTFTLSKADNGWTLEYYSHGPAGEGSRKHVVLLFDYDDLVEHLMTLYPDPPVNSVGELLAHQQFADATLPEVATADPAEV